MTEPIRCLIIDDETFSQQTFQTFVQNTQSLTLVGICNNAIEAANFLLKEHVDLIFLDIDLPGMSGFEFLQSRELQFKVILITAHVNYAVEAFEYPVADFLPKPVKYARFLKAVEKIRVELEAERSSINEDSIFYIRSFQKKETVFKALKYGDVYWIKADGDYIEFITTSGTHRTLSTLKEIQDTLPKSLFMRVHRTYIVNFKKISAINDAGVYINQVFIPIGVTYRDQIREKIGLKHKG